MSSLRHATQQGTALIVSLILLLILTVLGVTAMRNTTLEEKMAGNMRDLSIAFNAAEAGLHSGETALAVPVLPPFDGKLNMDTSTTPATITIVPGTSVGYYQADTRIWEYTDWGNGQTIAATAVPGSAAAPHYYLEELPATSSSLEAGAPLDVGMYRITALGYGQTTDATVVLQETFKR